MLNLVVHQLGGRKRRVMLNEKLYPITWDWLTETGSMAKDGTMDK
jgi:hypothetical protein